MGKRSRWEPIVHELRHCPALVETLPAGETSIVRDALAGRDVYEIGIRHQMHEAAVRDMLGDVSRLAAGEARCRRVDVGGPGSDTERRSDSRTRRSWRQCATSRRGSSPSMRRTVSPSGDTTFGRPLSACAGRSSR